MKQFIKRRWPLLLGAFGVALFIGFLYHKGFRITYAPELENSWEAISACAAWVGAIGTILVMWYNHRSIHLAQLGVQQAVSLQLYEKRLELYTALSRDDAFKDTPLEVKIVYSEIIYELYKQISDLCNRKVKFMDELYMVFGFTDGRVEPCWNIGEEQFKKYVKQLDLCIKGQDSRHKKVWIEQKKEIQKIQAEIKKKHFTLEMWMRMALNDSIKNQ